MKTPPQQLATPHQRTMLLLPWYVNQSLQEDERQQVENHLRGCLVCRQELVSLARLSAVVRHGSDLEAAAESSFASLNARLSSRPTASARRQELPINQGFNRNKPKRRKPVASIKHLAMAASLLLTIIPLGSIFFDAPARLGYYTLSAARPDANPGGTVRVVFSKPLPQTELASLLSRIHGQVVDGPNSVGAYTIKLLPTEQNPVALADAVDWLRQQSDIILAEPVLEP